ncbi:MAG: hypothetical protein IJR19_04270, partial [Lachnospiraceae bacterium]|nr:hypothetical protein [Lachnospiraceae bacterium]
LCPRERNPDKERIGPLPAKTYAAGGRMILNMFKEECGKARTLSLDQALYSGKTRYCHGPKGCEEQ